MFRRLQWAGHESSRERWSDEVLLREASLGDTEAFRVFCVRSLPSLMRFAEYQCDRLGLSQGFAEDFCHDAIIKAISYLKTRANDPESMPAISVAWLNQIVYNLIRDFRRRSAKSTALTAEMEEDLAASPSSDERSADVEEIVKYFQWLQPNQRDMLELVLLKGMTIRSAGKQLHINEAAAYKTYERGLTCLRDLLVEHGEHVHVRS
jgi:RNA polymerase sigma factor (sigma-70 family)